MRIKNNVCKTPMKDQILKNCSFTTILVVCNFLQGLLCLHATVGTQKVSKSWPSFLPYKTVVIESRDCGVTFDSFSETNELLILVTIFCNNKKRKQNQPTIFHFSRCKLGSFFNQKQIMTVLAFCI